MQSGPGCGKILTVQMESSLGLPVLTEPGTYLLVLQLEFICRLAIGRLGVFDLLPGAYLYAGSACGSGGLGARLRHHLSEGKKKHWHIDHLRSVCKVHAIFWAVHPCASVRSPQMELRQECLWSQALARLPGAQISLPGFGSSDCRSGCQAHLVYLPDVERSELLNFLSNTAGAKIYTFDGVHALPDFKF
jgi:Uri superfamily endonuclease